VLVWYQLLNILAGTGIGYFKKNHQLGPGLGYSKEFHTSLVVVLYFLDLFIP
jgi:hypothetical protein